MSSVMFTVAGRVGVVWDEGAMWQCYNLEDS